MGNEQTACNGGCFASAPFSHQAIQMPFVKALLFDGHPGITQEEHEVLHHLVEAYIKFVALGQKHPDDNDEFRYGIHLLQQKIGMRVARRVDPDIWKQPAD